MIEFVDHADFSPESMVQVVNHLGAMAPASPSTSVAPLLSAARGDVKIHTAPPATPPPAMLPEENSGAYKDAEPNLAASAHETPAAVVVRDSNSPSAIEERNRRLNLLAVFDDLVAAGLSKCEAARETGESYTSLWRWRKLRELTGDVFPGYENSGRQSGWQHLLADAAFAGKLREIYLATVGASGANVTKGRRTAKAATALVCMAEEPECPPEFARQLRHGKFPAAFLRFLKNITPELEQKLRGPKHFQLNGLTSRRDLTLRFPDGSRGEMPAGFKWVFDDMSVNQPFFAFVDGRVLFSRQGLYAVDHRSLRWLGKMLVARPREAYRAEDILRFLRLLFGLYGKPDVIVFERGVWHARKIRGFRITETEALVEEAIDRPEMPEAERHLLSQGLSAIGVRVVFATSAHGKIIETCFNHFQDVLAVQARQFVNIGRHAGEFETAAKRLRQVRAFGKSEGTNGRSPHTLGFAPMSELSDRIDAAFRIINGKQNSRGEVPDEIWFASLAERPLPELVPTEQHVFFPDLREATVRDGRVTFHVENEPHDFRADWMITLGHGYRVFARFDATEPTLGAAFFNRETGPNNRRLDDPTRGYAAGELIGYAAWECPAPCLDVTGPVRGVTAQPLAEYYGAGAVDRGDTLRRRQNKMVATVFSAMPRPGSPVVKSIEARDGAGRVARVETSLTTSTKNSSTAPAPRARVLGAPVPTPEQFAARRARNRADADLARALVLSD